MKTALTTLVLFLLAATLALAKTQTRSFSRVVLLEEKGETSASVSVGDLNGDLAIIEERKKAAFLISNLGERRFGQLTKTSGKIARTLRNCGF